MHNNKRKNDNNEKFEENPQYITISRANQSNNNDNYNNSNNNKKQSIEVATVGGQQSCAR